MTKPDREETQIREMAKALGCFTEEQVRELADYAETTLLNHRRRGTGPSYIVFGRAILYPIKPLGEYLQARVRDRSASNAVARDLL